jgi:hypothetical protein
MEMPAASGVRFIGTLAPPPFSQHAKSQRAKSQRAKVFTRTQVTRLYVTALHVTTAACNKRCKLQITD